MESLSRQGPWSLATVFRTASTPVSPHVGLRTFRLVQFDAGGGVSGDEHEAPLADPPPTDASVGTQSSDGSLPVPDRWSVPYSPGHLF